MMPGSLANSIALNLKFCRGLVCHVDPPVNMINKLPCLCSVFLQVISVTRLSMVILLAFMLLLSHGSGNIHCAPVNHGNSTDMLALLDFKAATSDPTGALRSESRARYSSGTRGRKLVRRDHPISWELDVPADI